MTPTAFLILMGAVFAASLACYGLEQAQSIHPQVRRAAQVGISVLLFVYVGRVFGLLPL